MNRRAMFSERHEQFLPMDICPAFAVSSEKIDRVDMLIFDHFKYLV